MGKQMNIEGVNKFDGEKVKTTKIKKMLKKSQQKKYGNHNKKHFYKVNEKHLQTIRNIKCYNKVNEKYVKTINII